MMKLFKILADSLPWPLWIKDMQDCYSYVNKVFLKVYHKELEEVLGLREEELFPDQDLTEYYLIPMEDENGQKVGMAGIMINNQSQAEEVENERNTLRSVIDAIPELIFYKDKNSKYLGYNKAYETFYKERGIEMLIGKTDLEILEDQETAKAFIALDQQVIKEGKTAQMETIFPEPDGELRYTECIKAPLINGKGESFGIVGLSRDITEKKVLEDKLRYLSYTDSLTEVFNRAYFEERLQELNKPEYFPLGMIMGDVNGLKIVNDTLGHLEGDNLLKAISSVLKQVCEGFGDIFRWGGDEFVILIPQANEETCQDMVDEIREQCRSYRDGMMQLSIALGTAIKQSVEEDSYKCLKRAEEQVYYQKLLEEKFL